VITADELASSVAIGLDGEYDDWLGVYLGASANQGTMTVKVKGSGQQPQTFRAVFIEVV
jgi:hypothetical protein